MISKGLQHAYCFRYYLINCNLIIFPVASMLWDLASGRIVLQFATKLAQVQSYDVWLCLLDWWPLLSDLKNWDPDVVTACSTKAHLRTSSLSPSDILTAQSKPSLWLCVLTLHLLVCLSCACPWPETFLFCYFWHLFSLIYQTVEGSVLCEVTEKS